MPQSTTINLPRNHQAQFPPRCVICNAFEPNSKLTAITGTLGWWTWVLFTWGGLFKVCAPACRRCAWTFHLSRAASVTLTITIAFAALWVFWPYLDEFVPRGIRRWAMMGFCLLCVLPQILYEVFYPKPFDVTAYAGSVDYEFANSEYAIDFALCNGDAKQIRVNGNLIEIDR